MYLPFRPLYEKEIFYFKIKLFLLLLAMTAGVIVSQYSYLLFHVFAELFTIVISFSIALIVINTRAIVADDFFSFLGISFAFSGLFDLLHILVYQGMGVFPDVTPNVAPQMWLVARYIDSITLLISTLFLRRINLIPLIAFYSVLSVTLILSILKWNTFPICFIEGQGLTPFKVISEYIICAILIAALVLLIRNRKHFHKKVFRFLVLSFTTTIATELSFTFYVEMYGFSNLIGHLFKVLSYFFLYEAIIETSLKEPYNLLFFRLKKKTKELEYASFHDSLTGLYNRAYFDKQIHLINTNNFPLSLISFDIDGLKQINDMLGHAMGDKLLKNTAKIFQESFRINDIIARIGGDEFIVIMPETDQQTMQKLIDSFSRKVTAYNERYIDVPIYISFGCSSSAFESFDFNRLLKQADQEMYYKKTNNRLLHQEKIAAFISSYQRKNQ